MKKYIVFFMVLFFMININLFAVCNNKTIIKDAKNVIVTSFPEENEEGYLYFIIKIENLKGNQAVVVSEDDNNTKKTYKYSDSEKGVIEIRHNYIFEKVNYTVKVYSLDSSCQNMLIETKKVSTIKFNNYSKYDVCTENPEFEMCDPFYDGEISSKEIFNNALKEFQDKKEQTFLDKLLIIVKEYYLYVLLPIVIIVLGYYILLGIKKWRKRI